MEDFRFIKPLGPQKEQVRWVRLQGEKTFLEIQMRNSIVRCRTCRLWRRQGREPCCLTCITRLILYTVNDFKCAKHSEHIAVLTLLLLLYIPRISKVSYWATGIFVPRRSADDRTTSRNRPCGSASQRPVLEAVETLGTAICSCSGVRCNSQSSNFHLALIQRSCLIKFSASYFFNINEHRAALQIVCWSFAFNSLVFSISPRTAFHASPFCISCGSSYHQGPSRMIQLWFLIAEAKQQRHS